MKSNTFMENLFACLENVQVLLLLVVAVLLLILHTSKRRRGKKLPPGPIGLPLFGYYFFLGKEPQKTLHELGKKYGNVIGFYLGPQYVVILNDWEAMKEATTATVDHPPSLYEGVPFKFGIDGVNGLEWIESRRSSSRAMKDISLHHYRCEQVVQEEAADLVKGIIGMGERPVDIVRFLRDSTTKNIVSIVLGNRQPLKMSIAPIVADAVDTILEYTPVLGMMNFSPTLYRILQIFGLEKEYLLTKKLEKFAKQISDLVDEINQHSDADTSDSLTALFYEDFKKQQKSKEKIYITESIIKGTVISFLTGGSETSRSTLIWSLIALAENPDKQRKVHEELDKVLGKDGSIGWPDRTQIPYTYATLMEAMRWTTVVPFVPMRIANEDLEVQGYYIPKGTFLTVNSHSLHNDPRYWHNPDQFEPERFLLEDGLKVNPAPESYNPFSYGKRNCPAKFVAMINLLQYFCILMQKFKVMPKEGNKVEYNTSLGLTYQATGVELRFIPR